MRRYLIPCAGPVAAHGVLGPKDEFRIPRLIVAATTFFAMTLILVPLARAAGVGVRQNITGTVKDALNRPLPDVQLKLQTGDGRILGRTRSSLSGTFEFRNVPAGTYAIQAKKSGFTQGVEFGPGRVLTGLLRRIDATKAASMTVVNSVSCRSLDCVARRPPLLRKAR